MTVKKLFFLIITLLTFDLLVVRCANPISPTGGPKDTIPPVLLNSVPVNGSLNFDEQTIDLEFSEFINAEKLLQNLIITPKSEFKYKHVIKRNKITIKFEEPFLDSTTYSLNFFDGITDITEKNPAVNLILAFSTGSFIDSAQLNGKIVDLMTQKPIKGIIVGLYPISDSLDFLSQSPTYFTTANDSGEFNLSYVKNGDYKILGFKDENRNLLLDPKEEDHGFLSDTLTLLDSLGGIEINSILQNVKPIKKINNRPIRAYYEIKYDRDIDSYTVFPDTFYTSISGEDKDIIRIYNRSQLSFTDSLEIIVQAFDSLSNTSLDTMQLKFNEYEGRQTEFKINTSYNEEKIISNPLYKINFNKPIFDIDSSKFIYKTDSTFSYQPDSLNLNWNYDKTQLELTTYLNVDSLYKSKAKTLTIDSTYLKYLPIDSIEQLTSSMEDSLQTVLADKSKMEFVIESGAFYSVENDTSTQNTIAHRRFASKAIGTLKLVIETDKPSFIIQLLDSRGEVSYEMKNNVTPSFDVKPATYTIRVLIDSNNDGKWSVGNLIKNIEPEEVYLFPEKISIRENWIVEDIILSF